MRQRRCLFLQTGGMAEHFEENDKIFVCLVWFFLQTVLDYLIISFCQFYAIHSENHRLQLDGSEIFNSTNLRLIMLARFQAFFYFRIRG